MHVWPPWVSQSRVEEASSEHAMRPCFSAIAPVDPGRWAALEPR